MAGVNSRVATALVGCTAPVLKSHTHIKNRGAENSLLPTPTQNLNHLSSIFNKYFYKFFSIYFNELTIVNHFVRMFCNKKLGGLSNGD